MHNVLISLVYSVISWIKGIALKMQLLTFRETMINL